jgi:dTDP-4-amino-4,6-dideoxygalactose transaminase
MTENRKVPFLDLASPHRELESELLEVCRRAIETANFIGGPEVEGFENQFAEFSGTKYCVGVNSGTDALRFALIATGIQPGDIVITVPNTFIATTEAISQAGAQPDFVDIDERTFNMDPEELRRYFETKCRFDAATGRYVHRATEKPVTAVIPVHLYGQMADMDAIADIAEQYKLKIIEDACQAHGARYFSKRQNRWRKAGSIGRAAAFSFYPGKNLGACGEGGAVTTDSAETAKIVRMLRDHGQAKKYYHDIEGYNGRLDAIQAGFLRIKLAYLEKWNEQRRERAAEYTRLLSHQEMVTCPFEPSWSHAVYHLYVIRTANREGMIQRLKAADIDTGIHYPVPLHMQKAYSSLNYRPDDFPVASQAALEIVSLPMFPQLTSEQQARVADEVLRFVQNALISL